MTDSVGPVRSSVGCLLFQITESVRKMVELSDRRLKCAVDAICLYCIDYWLTQGSWLFLWSRAGGNTLFRAATIVMMENGKRLVRDDLCGMRTVWESIFHIQLCFFLAHLTGTVFSGVHARQTLGLESFFFLFNKLKECCSRIFTDLYLQEKL